jgi:hypothetical protein
MSARFSMCLAVSCLFLECGGSTLSSRPERPDFPFRAAFWRVGPRSGGIAAQSQLTP